MKKRVVLGISLLEVLVYTAVSTLLLSCMGSIAFHVMRGARAQLKALDSDLSCAIALNCLAFDIHRAARVGCAVKKATTSSLIITIQGKDIGWMQKKDRLMRYEGNYTCQTGLWSHVSSSRILPFVDELAFEYTYSGSILQGVLCTIKRRESASLTLYCALPTLVVYQ